METLADTITATGSVTGLFLTLVTLFTNEQSRLREIEQTREGGGELGNLTRIRRFTWALLGVTVVTWVVLLPTVVEVLRRGPGWPPHPVLTMFVLTWLLLIGLAVWQVAIIRSSSRP